MRLRSTLTFLSFRASNIARASTSSSKKKKYARAFRPSRAQSVQVRVKSIPVIAFFLLSFQPSSSEPSTLPIPLKTTDAKGRQAVSHGQVWSSQGWSGQKEERRNEMVPDSQHPFFFFAAFIRTRPFVRSFVQKQKKKKPSYVYFVCVALTLVHCPSHYRAIWRYGWNISFFLSIILCRRNHTLILYNLCPMVHPLSRSLITKTQT
ncbi:MAG: hypothetical protein JOS17DRAFT_736569 [Linnemannia elongata]|nr:MAG: hypothetical protein JOS17DRAFT_736569 [Linnemannia elongata]